MAKTVFNNPTVKLKDKNGTTHDLSAQIQSAALNYGAEEQDSTAFGDATRNNITGLKNWSVTLTMFQDFSSAAEVDAFLFDEVGADTAGTVEIIPDAGASVDKNNPSFNGSVYVSSYPPFTGAVGDVMTFDLELTPAGALSRDTSAQL